MSDTVPVIQFCMLTDVGHYRQQNEDSIRCIQTDEAPGQQRTLAIVADGMGGHQAGDQASRLAVDVIVQEYDQEGSDPRAALCRAFQRANQAIYTAASKNRHWAGMGTTATALLIQQHQAYMAHVGDSRLYLLRDKRLYQLSEDHTMVMDLFKQGLLNRDEVAHHPDKNILQRSMGTHSEVEVSAWLAPIPLKPGDRFLLCSDGLSDLVEPPVIEQIMQSDDLSFTCSALIQLAKDLGGYDNISVGLVAVESADDVTCEAMPGHLSKVR